MTDSIETLVAPLDDLCVIEIAGADAASFLHGQLTHDISGLQSGSARLAGYCTAKGRLLGSLVVWQGLATDTPALYALAKADIAQALIKRLSMFVLRAKAKLRLTDMRVYGITLPHGQAPHAEPAFVLAGLAPDQTLPGSAAVYTTVLSSLASWIAAPSADTQISRWWLVQTTDTPNPVTTADSADWQAADIAAGLPWVVSATQDTFIPQTLNLDLIDGVSFTKGCYPGQEVVARSHYRGTVKRRMAYGVAPAASVPATQLPGVDIYDAAQPDSPCGRVINAATTDGQTHLLLEIQLSDLAAADFRLAAADGEKISIQTLPYAITA